MSSSSAGEMFVNIIHPVIRISYILLLIVLIVLWPSFSMILLGFIHLLGVMYHGWTKANPSDISKNPALRMLQNFTFHLENSSTVMNKIHFFFLVGTFLSFFHHYEQNGAVVSIKIAKAEMDKLLTTGLDHSSIGDTKKFNTMTIETMKPAELAQQGYYFAERYVGKVGFLSNTTCNTQLNSSYGWNCFVVGVRHYYGGKNPDDTYFQPLPTPAYQVDLMVATDDSEAGANLMCNNLDTIYLQRVDGNGNMLGPMRPLFEGGDAVAAPGTTATAICPDVVANMSLGCSPAIFPKTHAQYKATLTAACQKNSDVQGLRQTQDGVYSSFIPIPGADITVDPHTGKITYTIIIMRTSTRNVSQPVLRVTVANPVAEGSYTFFTPKSMLPVPSFGHDIYDDIKNRFTGQKTWVNGFMMQQRYGDNFTASVSTKNIPQAYFRLNVYVIFWVYTVLFLVAIMISWYYMVTDAFNAAPARETTDEPRMKMQYRLRFDTSGLPLYVLALYVKVPLTLAALATGMWGYSAAVGSHAIAYMVWDTMGKKNRDPQMRFTVYSTFIFFAWVLYILTMVFWILGVTDGGGHSFFDLMFFPAFAKERMAQFSLFLFGNPSSLFSNYIIAFVIADSIANTIVTTLRTFNNLRQGCMTNDSQ